MSNTPLESFLASMLGLKRSPPTPVATMETNAAGTAMPTYGVSDRPPVKMTEVHQPDGRLTRSPPPEAWDDWVEFDGKEWPKRVPRRYTLVPTICFNCESACGLLAYVDKTTLEVRKFEGNPTHAGSSPCSRRWPQKWHFAAVLVSGSM